MDIKKLNCIFCGKSTTVHTIRTKKKINDKLVTITNAPIHYCKDCKEKFVAKETQDVINFIRENHLERRTIVFDFKQLQKELCSSSK